METAKSFQRHPSARCWHDVSARRASGIDAWPNPYILRPEGHVMVWGSKKSAPLPVPEPNKPAQSPDQIISEMLSAYQRHFYETAKGQPDPSIEAAKAKVDRAYQVVSQSRIGYSVCAILEHVKHWPSWSERDDFQKWVGFPASNVSGSREKVDHNHDQTTVNFSYSGTPYSLTFIDRGISTWSNDMTAYGTVELFYAGELVVGLDIGRDISKDCDRWRFHGVNAFAPGEWMKQVVEMAALIDAHNERSMNQYSENDALQRASRIKLE
jgi:hypothetical protein